MNQTTFTVGISYEGDSYSITIRRLGVNKHWKLQDGNPKCIYDSRDPNPRMFAILFEGDEVKAKFFAEQLKSAYFYQGITKVTVKSDDE